jgi:hypothetical protein
MKNNNKTSNNYNLAIIAIVAALGLLAAVAVTVLETADAKSSNQGQCFKEENLSKAFCKAFFKNNP